MHIQPEELIENTPIIQESQPSPEPVTLERRSGRTRHFPRLWRDFEATSYTPVEIPSVNREVFNQRIEPLTSEPPAALSAPDMSSASPHHTPPNRFGVCRVLATPSTTNDQNNSTSTNHIPPGHPFRNDSIFEMVNALYLGPSSKTSQGMDSIAELISSGKVKPEELSGFKASTELRRLDKFAAESTIAGGPWKTTSVKIKMPCAKANNPSFSTEAEAPEFEIRGVRYRSLVDLIISKVQDCSSSESFIRTPFTEWWSPPGSTTPMRVYGEAYSSDIAVKLFEDIKGIPRPADNPGIEDVVVLLMLGSDATHLANFGTAMLWPIYVFFGNTSKYDSSRPTEFPACHLAYLPKVK